MNRLEQIRNKMLNSLQKQKHFRWDSEMGVSLESCGFIIDGDYTFNDDGSLNFLGDTIIKIQEQYDFTKAEVTIDLQNSGINNDYHRLWKLRKSNGNYYGAGIKKNRNDYWTYNGSISGAAGFVSSIGYTRHLYKSELDADGSTRYYIDNKLRESKYHIVYEEIPNSELFYMPADINFKLYAIDITIWQ